MVSLSESGHQREQVYFCYPNSDIVYQQSTLSSFSIMLVAIWFMVTRFYIRIFYIVLRESEREREIGRERGRERNVFNGNSTSWITNMQGAKYKIQVNSN